MCPECGTALTIVPRQVWVVMERLHAHNLHDLIHNEPGVMLHPSCHHYHSTDLLPPPSRPPQKCSATHWWC